ncbi:hypothetical protein KUL97_13120 [Synechococcus sp. HK05]|uniref:hypothetical protein n=1 Tax=Synechococcus sp. HK05 TaxID=2725975 RepID=UPI001C394D15|nr:hypothetical protein [Synechococcus sp. HK05]MBV2352650.1 hypothetical protein [Synechococcus sp. HK05]
MKREWPFLALEVVLLLVLLQSNAPEVWFWFIALLVLLTWRSLALRQRLTQRLTQRRQAQAQAATAEPPPPAAG